MTPADNSPVTQVARELEGVETITEPKQVQKLSRDYSWFSPVLREALEGKVADLVVRPKSEDEVVRVAAACATHRVNLTLRGAGTGNYGQSTPLHGGVVMDMSRLNEILWVKRGVARVQAGTRLGDIDLHARPLGWEQRLLPSTYRSATIAGFFAGGFGGVGSITYGRLAHRGNVLGLKAITLEATPQAVELRGDDALALHHAYGVNGIITEVELALAPAFAWAETIIVFDDFMTAVRCADVVGGTDGLVKKLLTVFANPIPRFFPQLAAHLPAGCHAVFVMAAEQGRQTLAEIAAQFGGKITYQHLAEPDQPGNKSMIEYAWNHTTMLALRSDSSLTYLQTGFPAGRHLELVEHMYRHFGDELMMHLEFLRDDHSVTCSGIQLLRYTGKERLDAIIAYHREHGVHVANPHTYIIEEGNRRFVDPRQVAAKRRMDPNGLLNPGKLQGWEALA